VERDKFLDTATARTLSIRVSPQTTLKENLIVGSYTRAWPKRRPFVPSRFPASAWRPASGGDGGQDRATGGAAGRTRRFGGAVRAEGNSYAARGRPQTSFSEFFYTSFSTPFSKIGPQRGTTGNIAAPALPLRASPGNNYTHPEKSRLRLLRPACLPIPPPGQTGRGLVRPRGRPRQAEIARPEDGRFHGRKAPARRASGAKSARDRQSRNDPRNLADRLDAVPPGVVRNRAALPKSRYASHPGFGRSHRWRFRRRTI